MKVVSTVFLVGLLATACEFHRFKEPQSSSDAPHLVSPRLSAVREILRNRCSQCHAAFPSYSESSWVSMNYVVPGVPSESLLYRRLKGSNAGGTENMPQGGTLSSAELATFRDWISTLDPGTGDEPVSDSGKLTATQRTSAALAVLARSCSSCHGSTQTGDSSEYLGTRVPAFAGFEEDSDFVIGGLVNPGDPAGSWILKALKGYGTIGTMPNGSAAISPADQESLVNWIELMGEP